MSQIGRMVSNHLVPGHFQLMHKTSQISGVLDLDVIVCASSFTVNTTLMSCCHWHYSLPHHQKNKQTTKTQQAIVLAVLELNNHNDSIKMLMFGSSTKHKVQLRPVGISLVLLLCGYKPELVKVNNFLTSLKFFTLKLTSYIVIS